MKKLFSICLAIILCFGMVSCTNEKAPAVSSAITKQEVSSVAVKEESSSSAETSSKASSKVETSSLISSAVVTTSSQVSSEVSSETVETSSERTPSKSPIIRYPLVTETSSEESSSAATTTSSAPIKNTSTVTPLLYKVTSGNDRAVYLFGSVHVGDTSMYPLPYHVNNAFENSEKLLVEIDAYSVTSQELIDSLKVMQYTNGKITDHIPQQLYNKAKEILKLHNAYDAVYDYYMPVLWYDSINAYVYSSFDSEFGIDVHFMELAKKYGKKIEQIESVYKQYSMMASFSDELQTQLLNDVVISYLNAKESDKATKELIKHWCEGDPEVLAKELGIETEGLTGNQKVIMEEYKAKMLTERNVVMADYVEKALLDEGEEFVCVGAAHIVGEGGVADLLAKKGYTVTQIKE